MLLFCYLTSPDLLVGWGSDVIVGLMTMAERPDFADSLQSALDSYVGDAQETSAVSVASAGHRKGRTSS